MPKYAEEQLKTTILQIAVHEYCKAYA